MLVESPGNQKSKALFAEAEKFLPGGVNSPVRAFQTVASTPVFIQRAKGSRVWDVDGNSYIDFVGSWGTAILGHAAPEIIKKVQQVAELGLSFGAPTKAETELSKEVCALVPSIEKLRLVSSGTEACMSALRLARGYTKRDKILKFSGCYHGHSDMLLVAAGSGVATLGIPGSPGVPKEVVANTLVTPFNDLGKAKEVFAKHADQIAAVILEPFVGNAGFIRPAADFIQGLRRLCDDHGSLLIFDEVMTGFRVARSGAQELLNVKPDITTFGKIIGGGLPVGAYGGRKEIMSLVAPEGPIYQAGTLSGNPLAVNAGLTTLQLLSVASYEYLNRLSKKLVLGLREQAQRHKIPFQADAEGGMFGFFFSEQPILNFEQAQKSETSHFQKFFVSALEKGIYFAPSAFEAGFLSLAHTEQDIDQTIETASLIFEEMAKL